MKKSLIPFCIVLSFIFSTYTFLFADMKKGVESKLSFDIGWERLEYKEHEPVTGLDSHAKVNNAVLMAEGVERWRYVFGGLKISIPVFLEDSGETWVRSGSTYQTNNLQYRWTRADGYIGYSLIHWFNPYAGVRWSEGEQERDSFVVLGTPVSGSARELIRSWSLLVGIRGNGRLAKRWMWNYGLEYFYPIDVEVTNSALQGFKVTNREGYTIELKSGIDWFFTKALSIGLVVYGGRMHWEGSDFIPFNGGAAKWPENDTDYLGGGLNMGWKF